MKYFKLKIFNLILAAAFLFSCEEEGENVVFKGGTAPVLAASTSDDIVLEKSKEGFNSIQLQWTNPSYEFSNGSNTQDVFYTLEIDTVGSNFTNPKKVSVAFTRDLAKSFKVKDLNNTLSALELKDFVPHDFEFRVKATLASSSVPVYSNSIVLNITTYLDVVYPVPDKLYITGAATPLSWMGGGDPPAASQELTKINPYTFVIEGLQINGGSPFLFVPVYGNWDNKYGFTGEKEKNNVNGDTFQPGGNDFMAPATSKAYKITVNFKTGRYSFE